MLLQATSGVPRSAHVIVLGNEKGGSGKTTTAMHIAVALLKAGQRVATIDLDSRQKSFTHYIENRRDSARRGAALEVPGPVTALWPSSGSAAIAVVRDLETGKYAAYLITLACGA